MRGRRMSMKYGLVMALIAVGALLLPRHRSHAETTPAPTVPGYSVVPGWPQLPEGWRLGEVSGVAIDRSGDILVFHRGEHPLLKFKPDGRFVQSYAEGTVTRAHGLRVDTGHHLWTTDVGDHTVKEYDEKGKLLRVFGEKGKAGEDASHFDKPANIAFTAGGDFFIADGYGNARVVKYNRNGQFVKAWGRKGTEPGQFNLVHALALDSKGLLYVADRENKRVQIFDQNGKFIKMWTHLGSPFGLFMTRDDRLYIADGNANEIRIADTSGKLLGTFGATGTAPGQFQLPHDLAVAPNGDLYVAEITNKRIQKFVPSGGTSISRRAK